MARLTETDKTDLTTFLQAMVKTASFSGMEGNLAQALAHEMTHVGFDEVEIDDYGNVIGQIGNGELPHLLYLADMDTVGIGDIAAWEKDPFGGVIEKGILYGRGASNPKSGLASMVYGAKLLKDNKTRLRGTLFVVGGVQGEAAEDATARYILEQGKISPSWVVLGASTNLNVNIGQRGRLEIEVSIQGKACHASTPGRGTNAIYDAARIIFSLELMRSMMRDDPFLGAGSLAVTHIENIERTKNVIPDRCNFVIDRRLTLGETEANALAEIQGLMAKEGVNGVAQISKSKTLSYTGKAYTQKKSYTAWVIDDHHPLVKTVSKLVQRARNKKPQLGRWDFSTAGVFTMGNRGIPTVGFGPGDEVVAHTVADRVLLKDCFLAAGVYADIAGRLLK